MPWHSPLTWTIGQILTAAQLNDQIRDNMQQTAPGIVVQAGDMVYATGPNALTRLPIGTAGQVPTVNPTANGLVYAMPGSIKLAETILLADTASPLTFSGIAGTYRHLHCCFDVRSTAAAATANFLITLNGDASTSYNSLIQVTSGTAVTPVANLSGSNLGTLIALAATAPASRFTSGDFQVLDYARTNVQKIARGHASAPYGDGAGQHEMALFATVWKNTAAITSITFTLSAGLFATGSTFTLYGLP